MADSGPFFFRFLLVALVQIQNKRHGIYFIFLSVVGKSSMMITFIAIAENPKIKTSHPQRFMPYTATSLC